jgi:hypothetical protein
MQFWSVYSYTTLLHARERKNAQLKSQGGGNENAGNRKRHKIISEKIVAEEMGKTFCIYLICLFKILIFIGFHFL